MESCLFIIETANDKGHILTNDILLNLELFSCIIYENENLVNYS